MVMDGDAMNRVYTEAGLYRVPSHRSDALHLTKGVSPHRHQKPGRGQ